MNGLLTTLRELKLDGMRLSLEALRDAGESQLPDLVQLLTRLVDAEAEQRKITRSLSLAKRAKFRYQAGLQTMQKVGGLNRGKTF
jgi:hypothetical protein